MKKHINMQKRRFIVGFCLAACALLVQANRQHKTVRAAPLRHLHWQRSTNPLKTPGAVFGLLTTKHRMCP